MTKEEFITKHGVFKLNKGSNKMLMECCHTPEKVHPYHSIFFLTGKMYNHGFFDQNIDLDKFETNWDLLSENITLVKKMEAMLKGFVHSSDTDEPYKAFIMTDFKYEKKDFLKDFLSRMGLYFKADGVGVYTNPLMSEIFIEKIGKKASVLMEEEPFEDYYEDVEKFKEVDTLFKENLINIRRISFNGSYSFNGGLPTFYVGETKEGNNLVGLFTVGIYT